MTNTYTDPKTGKFVPGNPGKPLGTRSFTTKVREALEKIADGKDYTYEEAFIKAIMKKAIVDQDTSMMRTVWEQLDGKPLQRLANADGTNLIQKPLDDLRKDNSLRKDKKTPEKDKDNPGGNVGIQDSVDSLIPDSPGSV